MANAALADKTTAVAVKAMGKSCFMAGENISHDIGKKDSKSPQTTNKNYAEYGDCRVPTRIQTVQPQSEAISWQIRTSSWYRQQNRIVSVDRESI